MATLPRYVSAVPTQTDPYVPRVPIPSWSEAFEPLNRIAHEFEKTQEKIKEAERSVEGETLLADLHGESERLRQQFDQEQIQDNRGARMGEALKAFTDSRIAQYKERDPLTYNMLRAHVIPFIGRAMVAEDVEGFKMRASNLTAQAAANDDKALLRVATMDPEAVELLKAEKKKEIDGRWWESAAKRQEMIQKFNVNADIESVFRDSASNVRGTIAKLQKETLLPDGTTAFADYKSLNREQRMSITRTLNTQANQEDERLEKERTREGALRVSRLIPLIDKGYFSREEVQELATSFTDDNGKHLLQYFDHVEARSRVVDEHESQQKAYEFLKDLSIESEAQIFATLKQAQSSHGRGELDSRGLTMVTDHAINRVERLRNLEVQRLNRIQSEYDRNKRIFEQNLHAETQQILREVPGLLGYDTKGPGAKYVRGMVDHEIGRLVSLLPETYEQAQKTGIKPRELMAQWLIDAKVNIEGGAKEAVSKIKADLRQFGYRTIEDFKADIPKLTHAQVNYITELWRQLEHLNQYVPPTPAPKPPPSQESPAGPKPLNIPPILKGTD